MHRPEAAFHNNDNDIDEFIDYDASAIDRERGEERWHHEKVLWEGKWRSFRQELDAKRFASGEAS